MFKFPAADLPKRYAHSEAEALEILQILSKAPALACDYETTGLKWHAPSFRPFYVSFCDGLAGYGIRIPTDPKSPILEGIRGLLGLEGQLHAYHNAKFDLHAGRTAGIEDMGEVHDTLIMAHILDENRSHKLDGLAADWLEGDVKKYSAMVDAWFSEHNMSNPSKRRYDALPDDILEPYAVQDTIVTWWLWKGMQPLIDAEYAKIYGIERAALRELVEIEHWGYQLDRAHLERIGPSLKAEAVKVEQKIRKLVKDETGKDLDDVAAIPDQNNSGQGELAFGTQIQRKTPFNLASPEDLARLFFGTLKIPKDGLVETANGTTSLGKYSLEKIDHPVAKMVEEWRSLTKMVGSFVDNLRDLVDSEGALHADFMQMGTVTGRMSCMEPNLQNLPKDGEVRGAFVARPGHRLWFFDYSQIELRILAHYCQDPVMLEAFRNGRDLHRETAAVLFNKGSAEVTDKDRDIAKKTNFSIVYGSGKKGLANLLKFREDMAAKVLQEFFAKFPSIKQFRDAATARAETRGWVMTHWGRHRRFPLRKDLIRTDRRDKRGRPLVRFKPGHPRMGEEISEPKWYTSVNGIVSGTATGDLSKLSLGRLGSWGGLLKATGAHIVSMVHDEFQIEIPIGKEAYLVPRIKEIMEDHKFTVPIVVDVAVSEGSWKDKKKADLKAFSGLPVG